MIEMSKRWVTGLLVLTACAGSLCAALPDDDVTAEGPAATAPERTPQEPASPATSGPLLTIHDPKQETRVTIGALGNAPAGALGESARAFLLEGPQGARWTRAGLTVLDVQDGTPVRLVRMRSSEGVVQVVFGNGAEVIGVAVSTNVHPASAPNRPLPVEASASGTRPGSVFATLPDTDVTPGTVAQAITRLTSSPVELTDLVAGDALEGAWFRAARRTGSPARAVDGSFAFDPRPSAPRGQVEIAPEFLEVNAYHHASRGIREVVAYGAGPRYGAIVGRLGLTVDEDRTPTGRAFSGNAAYAAATHALYFARQDGFPGAADSTVVIHELGHAVWHALAGHEPDKRAVTADENGVYEGWADAFAALVTEEPVFGRWWLGAAGQEARDSRNQLRHDGNADSHSLGQVYSGLLWDLSRGRSRDEWRQLVLGGLQLAPQPVRPAALVAGLLLADRTFHGGRYADTILAQARARGIPCEIAR